MAYVNEFFELCDKLGRRPLLYGGYYLVTNVDPDQRELFEACGGVVQAYRPEAITAPQRERLEIAWHGAPLKRVGFESDAA